MTSHAGAKISQTSPKGRFAAVSAGYRWLLGAYSCLRLGERAHRPHLLAPHPGPESARGGGCEAMSTTTGSITETARAFFDACETGKGWAVCRGYCQPGASFAAQAEPLADLQTLQQYTEWMKGMLVVLPDASYAVKSFATDDDRNNVCAYAVFSGTHSGEGGPVPPTGKSTSTDYVYVMEFADGKISHMTKIWNAGWAMKELGWTG